MKKMCLILFLVLALTTPVLAQKQYHLKLLAVQEGPNGILSGSDADLYLELKEGTGRVFLDTYPLTKMDTQISTRFAKEIACHQYQLTCDNYDFIYTIKARSNIIGGPSAGAAISALTAIAMMDMEYRKDIAITGTINSGGIVGPVGGVKQKIEAASKAGLSTVLVAKGTLAMLAEENNKTNQSDSNKSSLAVTNVNQSFFPDPFPHEDPIKVIEVSDLDEVMFYLTGKKFGHQEAAIEENKEYTTIMSDLRNVLCSRADKLEVQLQQKGISLNETVSKRVTEQKAKADNETLQKDYYSAASYCFTASIALRTNYYQQKKLTLPQLWDSVMQLEEKIKTVEKNLSQQKIETITDLQTMIIVQERLNDVKEQLAIFRSQPSKNPEELYSLLSYSEERYFSALAWMKFFNMGGKKVMVDASHQQQFCTQKILEAEDRYQYITLFINEANLGGITKKLDAAKEASQNHNFELCFVKAIQAKGDANVVLSSLGMRPDELISLVDSKATAVKRVIAENTAEGEFPILGYSYYQYSNSLKNQDPITALFYLEYSLEMSDLSIYFPVEKSSLETTWQKIRLNPAWLEGFVVGALMVLIIIVFWQIKPKKTSKKMKTYFKSLRK